MPLGLIHLISDETEGAGALYFCGIADAIAAIHPVRLARFPVEMVCSECLRVYEKQSRE
jgi:hypothetical protein